MSRQKLIATTVASLVVFLFTAISSAQDAQRVAPKTLPPNSPAQLQTPPPGPKPAKAGNVLDHLRGLVFVDDASKLHTASKFAGISTDQCPMLDNNAFRDSLLIYMDEPLTLAKLNEICQIVVNYYKDHDRPVVDAIVPEQDVTAGTVQILVLEAHVGKIVSEGNKYFPNSRITGSIEARPGQPISQTQLLGDVDWLNRNPFRKSDVVLQPGDQVGQTDILINTVDHFPLRAYGGYENTGTASTGTDRIEAGFNWGNAFGIDDQLNYQFTTSADVQNFNAHSASYIAPLPWRHILDIFGNWSTSKVQTDPNVFQTGDSWQFSGRYEIPLPEYFGITNSIVFGGDFKRSNTNAEFGGATVYASNVNVVQGMLGYDLSGFDRFGSTNGSIELYVSPGHVGDDNSDTQYQNARAGAKADYQYVRLTANRNTNLPWNMALVTRFQGQIATQALLGSEELGVGGLDSVRGYGEREGNGDSGLIFSNEVHAPPINFMTIHNQKDQLIFLGFVDYGEAMQRDIQPPLKGDEHFLGVGPGISYTIGPWLSLNYDYGIRLAKGDPMASQAGRGHIRIIASFTY